MTMEQMKTIVRSRKRIIVAANWTAILVLRAVSPVLKVPAYPFLKVADWIYRLSNFQDTTIGKILFSQNEEETKDDNDEGSGDYGFCL